MSAKKNDGGPAFPRAGNAYAPDCTGMTLRDWFAGQALAGLAQTMSYELVCDIANGTRGGGPFVNTAYALADRMLKERSTNG